MKRDLNVKDVPAYIDSFKPPVKTLLKQMRSTIRKAAPKAEESISYGIPSYKQDGVLVYFAGYEHHIGFYATPTGHEASKKDLSKFKQGRGSVQFPLEEALPLDLVTRIVKFRLKENKEKASLKAAAKKKSK